MDPGISVTEAELAAEVRRRYPHARHKHYFGGWVVECARGGFGIGFAQPSIMGAWYSAEEEVWHNRVVEDPMPADVPSKKRKRRRRRSQQAKQAVR